MNEPLRKRFHECKNLTIEEAEDLGGHLATLQRDIQFWVGDLARYAEARWPDRHHQVWPEWVSHNMLARTAGVCRAYPNESDRRHECTYTQYMQNSRKPDRQSILEAIVDQGQTSDESRKDPPAMNRWLLAIDVNYFVHRFFHAGAGVEAGMSVAQWIQRTATRLKTKGLTDVLCCFDSERNHRKELTADWEKKYKDRGEKAFELEGQLKVARSLLEATFCCADIDGMEADDLMASAAKQFEGMVTLLTQDKDLRQCLVSEHCNILLDIEWEEDETSGEAVPHEQWLTAKQHSESKGLSPFEWIEFQCIAGDNVDGIAGCPGIGEKGAANLIQEFGTVEAVIAAAKEGHDSITGKKRDSLILFEEQLPIVRQLVTMRTDLEIPKNTRLA